ncbi:MAG: 4-hydroxy-tetrahydrodipicolinate reductase [Candidatus Latescibacteria bacterium]|nr:4-hydroxy-tetrahydrodipicolinate reductase [Candidatus Latescibacterota bacterium]
MRLVMNGALGRMGRRIITLAAEDSEITLTGAVDISFENQIGTDVGEIIGIGKLGVSVKKDLTETINNADVVVDFTWPDNILKTAEICGNDNIPLVIGTTGLKTEERNEFKRLVSTIPCVYAPNMSVGVNLLFKLTAEAAAILGDDYDIEISETHHRFKKDAPSGTANRLAEIVAETLDRNITQDARYGRHGITGERTQKEIGIHSMRLGDVVGEHTVTFGTVGERIELVHKAHSRDALAKGALRAAKFIVKAQPGLYDMQDILGLK